MRTATVFNYLVEATLIGSAVIVGVMLVRLLLRKPLGSRFVRALWLLAALRLLLPIALPNPLMNALKPTLSLDAGIRPMADQVRTRVGDAATALYWKALDGGGSPTVSRVLQHVSRAAGDGELSWLVLVIYVSGAIGMAVGIVADNLRFRRRLVLRAPGGELAARWEALCDGRGLKKPPRLTVAEGLTSVCVIGGFRPCVAVPAEASEEALQGMLGYACAHARLRVGLWALVRNLCLCIQWFNPLVWVSAHLSRMDDALACDEWAAAPLDARERERYASWLIHQQDTPLASPAVWVVASCVTMSARALTMRIRQLLHPGTVRLAALGAVCLAAALTLSVMFATDEQSSVEYIPLLLSPPIASAGDDLTVSEGAEAYARRFLALEGIDAGRPGGGALVTQTEKGWHVSLYMPSGESCEVAFDRQGTLTYFEDTGVSFDGLRPLAEPITADTREGRAWCEFVAGFLARHVPAVYEAFDAMDIAASGRIDGEEYLTIHLLDAEGALRFMVDMQVAPVGRILRFRQAENTEESPSLSDFWR